MADPTETQVLAIAAHKGGVGKTTTAMALAVALARFHHAKVLLIDLDPQGQSTETLGVRLTDEDLSVREVFLEQRPPPLHKLLRFVEDNLWVLPANIHLEEVAQLLTVRSMRQTVLGKALRPAFEAGSFDWVVIDCPPSLGPLVENALAIATLVLIPYKMEAFAAAGLIGLVEKLQVVKDDNKFDQWRVLRTQVDRRLTETNSMAEWKLEPWQAHVLETIVPACAPVNKAAFCRQDIYTYAAGEGKNENQAGAAAYRQACEEVLAWANRTRSAVVSLS